MLLFNLLKSNWFNLPFQASLRIVCNCWAALEASFNSVVKVPLFDALLASNWTCLKAFWISFNPSVVNIIGADLELNRDAKKDKLVNYHSAEEVAKKVRNFSSMHILDQGEHRIDQSKIDVLVDVLNRGSKK